MDKNLSIVGEVVNIAEHSTYLELTSRVCYYDEMNLNGDKLPYDDTSEEKAKTLIHMPVQAKYRVNANNEPTFGSHEMVKKKDGSVDFRTSSIGTHTDVYIEDDNVEIDGTIRTLPCLFAKYRVWKRYKNVVAAVRRLFDLKKLYSSWEILVSKYTYEDGVRSITDYEFLANCLLGYEYAYPSYGINANAISCAAVENDDNAALIMADALSKDLIGNKNINKEVSDKMDNATETATNATEPVAAQLTSADLYSRISKACRDKLEQWGYILYWFPDDKEVWYRYEKSSSELDVAKFTYTIDDNDEITVSEPEYMTLTVSIKEINSTVASLQDEIKTLKSDLKTANADLDSKNNDIIKAGETIISLKGQILDLEPYKAQAEKAEQERIEAEIEAEKAALKDKLRKGDLFSEAEVEDKSIADLIESRDEAGINALIAERYIASFDEQSESKTDENVGSNTETTATAAVASLESDEDNEDQVDVRSFMQGILFN